MEAASYSSGPLNRNASREAQSLRRDHDPIARTEEVRQAHWYAASWRNPRRRPEIHLEIAGVARSIAEIENLRHLAADSNLRRDDSTLGQAGDVHRHNLAGHNR